MQRVSRDNVKLKQVNIAWTWLIEMTSRSENANENKWFGLSFAVNQNLSEETCDALVNKIHGKLREIGLKVKQGGYDLHMFEIRKVCEMQGGANVPLCECAAKNHRNRFKPVMLFFYSFFRHIQAKKTPCSVYSGRVLRFFFIYLTLLSAKTSQETTTILSEYRDGRKQRFKIISIVVIKRVHAIIATRN